MNSGKTNLGITIDCLSGANKIQLTNPAKNLFGFIFWNFHHVEIEEYDGIRHSVNK